MTYHWLACWHGDWTLCQAWFWVAEVLCHHQTGSWSFGGGQLQAPQSWGQRFPHHCQSNGGIPLKWMPRPGHRPVWSWWWSPVCYGNTSDGSPARNPSPWHWAQRCHNGLCWAALARLGDPIDNGDTEGQLMILSWTILGMYKV